MQTNEVKTIKVGQTLTARSGGDYECVFSVTITGRKGNFVRFTGEGRTGRVMVKSDSYGEFIFAMGRHSMCPIFRAV
jgi:hypothetical protein